MTGTGKSVIVADLLAQIGHRFGFRLIVEEGLSHAMLTQTQGCEPIISAREAPASRYSAFDLWPRLAQRHAGNSNPRLNESTFRSGNAANRLPAIFFA
ncbi:MAG TPA: hypothetical protein VJX28_04460 [Chthoniobacterales bacterium]|nr:hypothetical protein [Chthoniobacterales bacterium]